MRGGRGRSLQGQRASASQDFIAGRIARYGAMSESRVHPVISRYSFAREVTRLRENRRRERGYLSSLSTSPSRAQRSERDARGGEGERA